MFNLENMEALDREHFEQLFKEHAQIAQEDGAAWVFSYPCGYDETQFHHVVSHLRGIAGVKSNIQPESLTVTSIDGGPALKVTGGVSVINKYCLDESLRLIVDPEWKVKTMHASQSIPDVLPMPVRSDVYRVTEGVAVGNDVWSRTMKHYRIERTFEYSTPNCIYRIKMARETGDVYASMKIAEVGGLNVKYEYELQWLKPKSKMEDILSHVVYFTQILSDTPIPISKATVLKVQEEYRALISKNVQAPRREAPSTQSLTEPKKITECEFEGTPLVDIAFMAPKPITVEQRHLVPSSPDTFENINIWKNYCVTDKADGERMLLFFTSSGDAYFLNTDLVVKPAGMKGNKELVNTLIDGEFIPADHREDNSDRGLFAAFDIYYVKGKRVYDLPLVNKKGTRSRVSEMTAACATANWTWTENAPTHEFIIKTHHFAEDTNMMDACGALVMPKSNPMYRVDGLVFTPANLGLFTYYPTQTTEKVPMSMTWDMTLKWKPPDQNTIDFLVREVLPPIRDHATNTVYRQFDLYTGYSVTRSEPISVMQGLTLLYGSEQQRNAGVGDKYIKKIFAPISYYEEGVGRAHISIDVCAMKRIATDTIVEFHYNLAVKTAGVPVSRRWEPLRVREDKTRTYRMRSDDKKMSKTANDYKTAMSIWRSIHQPVTQEMLKGAPVPTLADQGMTNDGLSVDDIYYHREIPREHRLSVNMLNFHNNGVKRRLYKYVQGNDLSLLELACGQAGDMNNWREAGIKFVVGVDLVKDNICKASDGAYARALNQNQRKRQHHKQTQKPVFLIGDCARRIRNGDCTIDPKTNKVIDEDSKAVIRTLYQSQRLALDKENVYRQINGMASKGFSMVSCQFAIHYFFESEQKLDGFLDNVADNLKHNGVFITTFMDGPAVNGLLSEKAEGKAEGCKMMGDTSVLIWAIIKRYESYSADNMYGKAIDVYLETTRKMFTEYLVHPPTLISKLHERGIELEPDQSQLFSHTFNQIIGDKKHTMYNTVALLRDDPVQTQFSFLNRWMVFKKVKK
jgi:hypothetical protein